MDRDGWLSWEKVRAVKAIQGRASISRLAGCFVFASVAGMKFLCILAASLVASAGFGADAPEGKLAFERGEDIWTANLDGTSPKKIASGQAPELSPDGTKLAFNTVQAIGQPAHRQIAVADLATGAVAVFQDIPSDNCLQPVWSPDGTRLLFYFYTNNEMRIGLVNADGTGFRDVQKSEAKYKSYWAAAWAFDGQSFFAEDMENLYRLDLDAHIQKQWNIEKIVPHGGMGGDVRLHASADGKTLLMDIEMAEKERKGWDGPPPSIWVFDLAAEKATRLTPKTLYAWDAHWLDADHIIFSSQAPGESEPSIYRMSTTSNGKDVRLLVKKARLASASR
jgi:TolB protein